MSWNFTYDTYENVPVTELAKKLSDLDRNGYQHEQFYNPANNTFIILAKRLKQHQ